MAKATQRLERQHPRRADAQGGGEELDETGREPLRLVRRFQQDLDDRLAAERAGQAAWPEVWGEVLQELVADGVESFRCGEATHLALRGEGRKITIEHDGRLWNGGIRRVFDTRRVGGLRAFPWVSPWRYVRMAAWAARLEISACEGGGKWMVASRCGKPGAVQRMPPGVNGTGEKNGVRIVFTAKAKYLRAPCPERVLRRWGESLAYGFPGLRVSVNGRNVSAPGELAGRVAARMEELGEEPIGPVSAVAIPGAEFAWGIARRRKPGRCLCGRVFLGGWEILNVTWAQRFARPVCDTLCGMRCISETPCTVCFAFSVDIPAELAGSPKRAPRTWDLPTMRKSFGHCLAQVELCLAQAARGGGR